MKAIAVIPGKPNSVHLRDVPKPSLADVPNARGVLVKILRVGVDGMEKENNSGVSMSPARTSGSAFFPRMWRALWIYFAAPPLGMLLAAELYVCRKGLHSVLCAKLHHHNSKRCIFRCNFPIMNLPAGEEKPS